MSASAADERLHRVGHLPGQFQT